MNAWNLSTLVKDLICYRQSAPKPRKEIWASDLGKAPLDTYLKMKGTPYTNPTDGNGMFNFFMGKAIEQGLTQMLLDCGLAHNTQERLEIKLDGCLPVVGKPDVILEVKDWEVTIKNIHITSDDGNEERLTKQKEQLTSLIREWQKEYPGGLPKTAFEVKSTSEWGFNNAKLVGFKQAFPHYFLQAYTYLYGLDLPEVHLLFVSKGSKMMTEEIVILRNEDAEKEWKQEIKMISDNFNSNIAPQPEPLMAKNGWGKETLNWKLQYSPYRDHILSTYYPEYGIIK
jgi:hypothetical protein